MDKNICRLCLKEHSKMHDVFKTRNNLQANIFKCVAIKIEKSDEFSKKVCMNCYLQVMSWNYFKKACQKSDKTLKTQYLLQQSKDLTGVEKNVKVNIDVCSVDNSTNVCSTNNISNLKENISNSKRIVPPISNNENISEQPKQLLDTEHHTKETELSSINKIIDNASIGTFNIDKEENISNSSLEIKSEITDDDLSTEQIDSSADEQIDELKEYLLSLEREDSIASLESKLKTLKDTAYTCDICLKNFDGIIEYLDHQYIHEGELVFKCDRCSEIFTNKKELKTHESQHQVACSHCKKMILVSSMKAHLISHTNKYQCSTCTLCFATRANMMTHIVSIHTNIKDHVCETCGKRFSTKTSLTSHHKTHSDIRAYCCKFCSYAGRTASALYIHRSKHENASFVCDTCSKTFKSLRCLKDHKRRVHNKNKRYECSYCRRRFVEKYMLTVHLRTHTGVRPYECKVCQCTFVRSDGLKEHMGTHGDRPNYNCKKCGKNFVYRRSLTRHNCTQSI